MQTPRPRLAAADPQPPARKNGGTETSSETVSSRGSCCFSSLLCTGVGTAPRSRRWFLIAPLPGQLPNLHLADSIGLSAQRRRPIDAPVCAAQPFLARSQIAFALEGMEHRIERTRAQRVTVAGEFVDHPLAIKFFLRCVMKNVQPDQTYQQLLMFHSRHCHPPRRVKLGATMFRFSYLMA